MSSSTILLKCDSKDKDLLREASDILRISTTDFLRERTIPVAENIVFNHRKLKKESESKEEELNQ